MHPLVGGQLGMEGAAQEMALSDEDRLPGRREPAEHGHPGPNPPDPGGADEHALDRIGGLRFELRAH
ncbi:MAG TPA: hypothetical protein VNM87_00295, partial [Candidatus Udaeobacter sp.]|nr:hypothetical protein [Candidatus Udaeobacter sp.]